MPPIRTFCLTVKLPSIPPNASIVLNLRARQFYCTIQQFQQLASAAEVRRGNVIVMTELQPGRNGGPELTIIRKYPIDGSEVTMDTGMWAGAKATGKMEGNVLTVDTIMANGRKFHDVCTLAADGKHYTNDMVINGGGPGRGSASQGGGQGAGGQGGGDRAAPGGAAPRTVKFSFTKQD
jgi:hypothetical protein